MPLNILCAHGEVDRLVEFYYQLCAILGCSNTDAELSNTARLPQLRGLQDSRDVKLRTGIKVATKVLLAESVWVQSLVGVEFTTTNHTPNRPDGERRLLQPSCRRTIGIK